MERSRVGDHNPHLASKAQAAQGLALAFKVFPGVIQPDFMSLQEPVERLTSLEAKKLSQLRVRQTPGLVFSQSKSNTRIPLCGHAVAFALIEAGD